MLRRYSCLITIALWASISHSNSLSANEPPDQSTLVWQQWSPEIFKQAQREERLVLLYLTAEWCRVCKKMDSTTYRDHQVMMTIQKNYIPVRADRDIHTALAKQYENHGPPTTVIFNHRGEEIIKRQGYLKPQWMFWLLETVAANPSIEAHQ